MRSWRSVFRLSMIVAAALVWATPQVYASGFLTAGSLTRIRNDSPKNIINWGGFSTTHNNSDLDPIDLATLNNHKACLFLPGVGLMGGNDHSFVVNNMGAFSDYVEGEGVIILNVGGMPSGSVLAPGGIKLLEGGSPQGGGSYSSTASIFSDSHIYGTGEEIQGTALSSGNFSNWGPTSNGYLTDFPVDTEIVLGTQSRPTMIHYRYGAGHLIVSCMRFGVFSAGIELDHAEPAFQNLRKLILSLIRASCSAVSGAQTTACNSLSCPAFSRPNNFDLLSIIFKTRSIVILSDDKKNYSGEHV